MIIDGHAHLGNGKYSDVAYYLNEMEKYGIEKMVVCPGDMFDVTKMADFMRGKEPLMNYEPHNDWVKNAMDKYPDKFYGFFMVDPEIHKIEDIEMAIDEGFVGIKLNPLINKIDFYSDLIVEIFMFSSKNRIPIYTHLTMNSKSGIEALTEAVEKYNPIIIIGHMGFSSADWEAVELCRDNPNVYLETSVGAFRAIKEAISVVGANKLIFGSEGPSHNVNVELTKIKMLELEDNQMKLILHKNIEGLIVRK